MPQLPNVPMGLGGPPGSVPSADREATIRDLYVGHYHSLVRLAAMLVHDMGAAEEITQDAFVAMHGAWPRLRENDKALSYLRQSVVNRARSLIRRRMVAGRYTPPPMLDAPGAEEAAFAVLERYDVVTALRGLPARQREVLVLRYYADLSEAEIAKVMSISQGAVKSHAARGIAALRRVLSGLSQPVARARADRVAGRAQPC